VSEKWIDDWVEAWAPQQIWRDLMGFLARPEWEEWG
jgi:hypothetical protein